MSNITGGNIKIGELLGKTHTVFKIPPYQRSFAWKKEQVESWWEDIKENINSLSSEYFTGAMVYIEKEIDSGINECEVLDGQQRLTTTYIIYHLMRKIYEEIGGNINHDTKTEFDENIPNKIAFNRSGRHLKLELNSYDNGYFISLLENSDETQTQKSHKNLKIAYNYLKKELTKYYHQYSLEGFNKIGQSLSDNFVIMGINAGSRVSAYKLFEAMNDKGLKLSQNDLIKNYVFSKTEPGTHIELERSWKIIQEFLNSSNDYGFDIFIQYYWNGTYEEIRKNEVYKEFTKKFDNHRKITEEIKSLKANAEWLDMYMNPSVYEWETDPETLESLYQVIDEIKSLGVTQIHILIMQLIKYHGMKNNVDQTKKILLPYLKEIRNFIFKYSTVCKKQANVVLKRLCVLSLKVNHEQKLDIETFLNTFEDIIPEKTEVERNFYTFKSPSKLSRRILKTVFPAPRGFGYDNHKTQTEHVLPQTLDDAGKWSEHLMQRLDNYNKNLPPSEQKTFSNWVNTLTHSIGNHLLLYTIDNIRASNKFYDEKFNLYLKSNFPETKAIKEQYAEWNEASINNRSKIILKKLKGKWNLFS